MIAATDQKGSQRRAGTVLDAAIAHVAKNWPVFPLHTIRDGRCTCGREDCTSPGKHPRTPNGFKDATTNADTIAEWWTRWPDANIGIVTGAVSGLVVVDVDPRHDGDATLKRLEREHGPIGDTITVTTGGGGFHIYLQHPGGTVRSGASRLGPGADVKADGGYVVAPGSSHISGRRYEWLPYCSPEDVQVGKIPDWMLPLLNGRPRQEQRTTTEAGTVTQQGRNNTLTSLAGTMRHRGMAPNAIRVALREENRARYNPPLPEEEVDRIAAGILRYEPAPETDASINDLNLTDSGNAEALGLLYGDRLRYDHKRGRWLLWSGNWWAPDPDGVLNRLVLKTARARYRAAENIEDLDQRKAAAKFAIGSESRQRLDAARALARSLHPIADAGDGWDADPFLLGVSNGVVDLHDGVLRAGRPEDRITRHVETPFTPTAACPRWERFLDEVFDGDADLIDFAHRAVGLSLTGDTREQCLFICYGAGANGKSVFLSTLRHVLGPYAADTPFSTFELNARASIPSDLAALDGKRLVTASESNEGSRLNEARIKALTGQDSITARFLHHEWFTFEPECKLWLAVNHRPRVADDSLGFWRRVRMIPFVRQFSGAAADPLLAEALRAEAPGILAWAVRGTLSWKARGLQPPAAVVNATAEYREEADPLSEFLAERCTIGPREEMQASALYGAYREWAEGAHLTQRETLSKQMFGRRMGCRFERAKRKRGTFYLGVGVVDV